VRVLFLNQYFPPDPAPTGILLGEIADALAAAGHQVAFASSGQDYRAGQKRGSRLLRELRGLGALFRAALFAGRIDAVVSATSPPLLVVIAAAIAKLRRARHYHWLFDMYPELATTLGEIPESRLTRLFYAATRWAYRRADCVVALDQDMAARLKGYGVTATIIPPWVFQSLITYRAAQPLSPAVPDRPERIWLYSGNLGRAHEWRTLLDAQRLLEIAGSPWRLVFQGGGPVWPVAREYAAQLGLTRCDWRPYVPEDQLPASLLDADVLVVTQKPETCGLLWPSKLALVTSLPRTILWVGPIDRAIAGDLGSLPQAGVFLPGDAAGIARWLADADPARPVLLRDPVAIRAASLQQWVDIVGGPPRH
jgi:colanic acid biosynthesis glycosyl transferase WcaI